jgi:RND family efflux transporter MFP subunit
LGDSVKVGQKLAKIYDRTFRDQVLRDEAQVQQARVGFVRDSAAFVRVKKLYDQGLSSDADFQTASATYQASRAQLATAQAALTQSKENLQNTEVVSPVNGVILIRNGEEGDLATTAQPIVEIGNSSGYELRLFLPLQDWELVRMGQKVDLRITNQPSNAANGVVTRISPQLDAVTGLGEVPHTVNKSSQMLYAGALTESRINVVTKNDVLTVPRSSLIEKVQTYIDPESNTIKLQRNYSLFVTQGDTLALQKDVELGLEQGERVEILSGISQGDKIVITGQNGLENKAAIKVVDNSMFRSQQAKTIASGDSNANKTAAQQVN